MKPLESEVRHLTTLEKLFKFADSHIKELKNDVALLHLLKDKRRELKRVEWLHYERLQYLMN
jgi:preprotein translocase subunit SecE